LLEELFGGGIEGERHGESIPPGPMGRNGFLRASLCCCGAGEEGSSVVAAAPSLRPAAARNPLMRQMRAHEWGTRPGVCESATRPPRRIS
jgi:hypothetical protein